MLICAEKIVKVLHLPSNQQIEVLKNLDLTVNKGDFLAIIGPSGSGKSTLLQILGLMDNITSGRMTFNNQCIDGLSSTQKSLLRAQYIGFVFQQSLLVNDLTVYENLKLAGMIAKKNNNSDYYLNLLHLTGLADKKDCYPSMLSVGEAQRVAIARAMANSPSIIIADEPTSSLDKDNKLQVLEIFREINQKNGVTIILASHDELVLSFSKRKLFLQDGKLSE